MPVTFAIQFLNTVRFYLREKLPLIDYQPPQEDGQIRKMVYSQGYSLVFTFVRGDGISSDYMSVFFTVVYYIKFMSS